MVERHVVEVRLLSKQIAAFTEERPGGVEYRADDPGVEIVRAGRGVTLGEFAAVGRGSANNGVGEHRGPQVGDLPKLGGKAKIQRGYDEFQSCAPAQRSGSGEQSSHE